MRQEQKPKQAEQTGRRKGGQGNFSSANNLEGVELFLPG